VPPRPHSPPAPPPPRSEDAQLIARDFYKTAAVVKTPGGLATVSLNQSLFEAALRELLVARATHSAEVYEGSGQSWQLNRTGSPGRLGPLEEELFRSAAMEDAPVVMALTLDVRDGARAVGVAFCVPSTRTLGACQFVDDDHYCQLEALVAQLGARECVLPEGLGDRHPTDAKRLADLLSRCGALATTRPRSLFRAADLEADLAKLLKGGNVELYRPVLDRRDALPALAAVVGFLELLADVTGYGKCHLYLHDPGRFMRMDAEAQRALHVLPPRGDGAAGDTLSLCGLMGRARSAMGKRLLRTWLKQPLQDLPEIRARHDVVEAMVEDVDMRGQVRDVQMRGMPDVERLTRKLERRKTTLADLCQLYRASARLPILEQVLRSHEGPHAALLASRFADRLARAHDADHLEKFEALLEAAVDLDKVPDEYVICPRYSPELEELAGEKAGVEADIQEAAEHAAGALGLQLDKTIKLEWHKFQNTRTRCLRITAKEEKACRKRIQSGDFRVLETRKDGTKLTTGRLKKAAEALQEIEARYQSQQRALVEQVVGVAATFAEVWGEVAGVLAELDVLVGFADLSASAPTPYVRPAMEGPDGGELRLVGCRHPCLEAQDGVEFIKNDCAMARGESWFQIITGPNMGGKSTFIRQVGVTVLMAQVGCFVPCDAATIPVRDAIFARVGAGDCQLRGVSTFMAEMLETAAILKGASSRSLVIIDELGRGTSTYDGFGLAWAIAEHLMEHVGAPTLFATHFHELTAVRGGVGVANRHVETAVDRGTGKLTMLYQVREGACDQSFGIHVAEFANFPAEVVAAARAKARELEGASAGGAKRARDGEPGAEAGPGRARLKRFLRDVASLPVDTLAAEEALSRARELVDGLRADAAGDPVLESVLHAASLEGTA